MLNPDPKDNTGQSMYNDEFKTFTTTDRDKQTSDVMKKSCLRPWSDTFSYRMSNKDDYTPKSVEGTCRDYDIFCRLIIWFLGFLVKRI